MMATKKLTETTMQNVNKGQQIYAIRKMRKKIWQKTKIVTAKKITKHIVNCY